MPVPPAVNACAFSPDGAHLVCGTGSGRLHIWAYPKVGTKRAEADSDDEMPLHAAAVQAHGCGIYALAFAETKSGLLLLSSADEEIRGWKWDALLKAKPGKPPQPVLRLINPQTALRRGGLGQLSETSALSVDASATRLYSAAGDGNAYAWDLSAGTCVETFHGVGEPLHCLTLCERRRQLVTGGEDGAVRLWDVRSAKCSQTWLAAGWGDGFLCSIDLNTNACVACMPTAAAPLAVCFEPGSDFHLVSVGAESGLYRWTLTGELETRATCSSPSALGLAVSKRPGATKAIAVGGSAGSVDLFADTSHRAFTLCLHEE